MLNNKRKFVIHEIILIWKQNYEILQYYNHERSMTSKAIIRLTLSLWPSEEI